MHLPSPVCPSEGLRLPATNHPGTSPGWEAHPGLWKIPSLVFLFPDMEEGDSTTPAATQTRGAKEVVIAFK